MAKHAPIATPRNKNNPYKDHIRLRTILPEAAVIAQDFRLYTVLSISVRGVARRCGAWHCRRDLAYPLGARAHRPRKKKPPASA